MILCLRIRYHALPLVLGMAVVSFTGCSGLASIQAKVSSFFGGKSDAKLGGGESSERKMQWSYFQVKKTSIYDEAKFDGKLEASERIEIRSDKRLRLGPAKFKVADHVKRGDVLFVVDTKELTDKKVQSKDRVTQLNIDIKSSKSQFSFAEKQLERKSGLVKKGIAAQKELEEAQKAFVSAESDLKTKELELRKAERELAAASDMVATANVVSPIAGIIASIIPGGDEANQGQTLAMVSNPTELLLSGSVDESKVTKLKVGLKVEVTIEAIQGKVIQGVVKSIESVAQQGGSLVNSYKVSVAIAPELVKSLNLKDGYSARIRAVFSSRDHALVVPRSAIKLNGKDTYAMFADGRDQTPTARAVKIGIQTELETEIQQGLKEGDFIAVTMDMETQKQ